MALEASSFKLFIEAGLSNSLLLQWDIEQHETAQA